MIIHRIVQSDSKRYCAITPKQNMWHGFSICDRPTNNLVTHTTDAGHYYVDYPVCDSCLKDMQNESMDY